MHPGSYDFSKIAKYFDGMDNCDAFQVISDRTVNDLDLHDVFQYLDYTSSKVGQQHLYSCIRTIPKDSARIEKLEKSVSLFSANPKLTDFTVQQMSRLKRTEAYYIQSLFNEAHLQKPKWFWLIKVLFAITLLLFACVFFIPQLVVAIVIVLLVNMGVHYWNKRNLFRYSSAILQLLILMDVAEKLNKVPAIKGAAKVNNAIASIKGIRYKMAPFKLQAKLETDIGLIVEHFFEVTKAAFLIEPLMLFHVIRHLEVRKEAIREVFNFVGELDSSVAVMKLRKQLVYYCQPQYITGKCLNGIGLFHPLIEDCVPNTIALDDRSALFTGSNMAGKTTFIRIVGINAICAQTLNTCFAKTFSLPKSKIFSGIRISDNLADEKSYYATEVSTIREMITESRRDFQCIFLLDELFKGTNTIERIAAGKAVLTYLNGASNLVFISTHDLELVDYLSEAFNCYHFTEVIVQDTIVFDYKIKEGVLKTTNAIRLLELLDFPGEIIREARSVASQLRSARLKPDEENAGFYRTRPEVQDRNFK